MGGERLYPGQADPGSTDLIASTNRNLGQKFTCSQTGRYIVGGGIWVQANVYPERWQIWNKGTGVQLANLAMSTLNPSGTGWLYFTLAQLSTADIGPLDTATTYIVATWTPAGPGSYVFTNGGFSYPFGQSPLSTNGCIFRDNGTSTQIPNDETFTGGRFYADLTLDDYAANRLGAIFTQPAAIVRAGSW